MGIKIISTAAGLNKHEVGLGNVDNIKQAPLDHEHPATRIMLDDSGYYFYADNVEDALQEIAETLSNIQQKVDLLDKVSVTVEGDSENNEFAIMHNKGTKNVITSIRDENDNICMPLIKNYTNYVLLKFKRPQPFQKFYLTII